MSFEADLARSYRERADKLRAIADQDNLEETRRMLLRVAGEYDSMAKNMEALENWRLKSARARSPR